MLVIRDAQMEALRESRRAEFEDRAIEVYKSRGEPAESAREFVRHGIRAALSHELSNEDHILRFIDLLPSLADGADSKLLHPWAAEILADTELSSALKISLLERVAGKP